MHYLIHLRSINGGLNIYPTRIRITDCKDNNLTINYKNITSVSKSSEALIVFIYCQSQSDRGEQQHTKNGGAPWLPEPSMENNDKHSLSTDGSYDSTKSAPKTTQNAKKSAKTTLAQSQVSSFRQIQTLSVEKQARNTV